MTVENMIDTAVSDIFSLMLSQNYVCGFIFELCGANAGEVYYDQLLLEKY